MNHSVNKFLNSLLTFKIRKTCIKCGFMALHGKKPTQTFYEYWLSVSLYSNSCLEHGSLRWGSHSLACHLSSSLISASCSSDQKSYKLHHICPSCKVKSKVKHFLYPWFYQKWENFDFVEGAWYFNRKMGENKIHLELRIILICLICKTSLCRKNTAFKIIMKH